MLITSDLKLLISPDRRRIKQLLRAEWKDFDFENRVLTFKDGKGRPGLGVKMIKAKNLKTYFIDTFIGGIPR